MRTASARTTPLVQPLEPRRLLSSVGTLRVTVFDDVNNNGHRDKSEPTVSGVDVWAVGKDIYGLGDAMTGSDGVAAFPNPYKLTKVTVSVFASPDFESGKFSELAVNLKAGETQSVDFPVRADPKGGAISIRLFRDRDRDGRRDIRDPFLAGGQRIDAYRDDKFVAAARTRADGYARFTGLGHGDYTFSLHDVPRDADDNALRALETPLVSLAINGARRIDAGVQFAATISGIAFHDRNANGRRDKREPLIRDAYVQVAADYAREADTKLLTENSSIVHTDANGHYVKQLPLDDDGQVPLAISAYLPDTAERVTATPIDVNAGADIVRNLPFVRPLTTGAVTLQAFIDLNENGILDGTETIGRLPKTIGYVSVTLERASKRPEERLTGWDRDGVMFFNLVPATYNIRLDNNRLSRRVTTGNRNPHFTIAAGESKTLLIGVTLHST